MYKIIFANLIEFESNGKKVKYYDCSIADVNAHKCGKAKIFTKDDVELHDGDTLEGYVYVNSKGEYSAGFRKVD